MLAPSDTASRVVVRAPALLLIFFVKFFSSFVSDMDG
jgi:hypothetical protein